MFDVLNRSPRELSWIGCRAQLDSFLGPAAKGTMCVTQVQGACSESD